MKVHPMISKTCVALALSGAASLMAPWAWAATAPQADAMDLQRDCDVRLGSGPRGGVYEVLAQDIVQVCGNAVSVCIQPSEGGLENITRLTSNEIDLGFAQIDTLQELRRGGDEAAQSLQAVLPLHANLMHVIALTNGSRMGMHMVMGREVPMTGSVRQIRRFSDLREARVAVVGSAQMLGQLLEKQLGYRMEFLTASNDDAALAMLKANQVQAIFTSGGWPMPNITRYNTDSGLTLVEYDLPVQPPYQAVRRTYKNLGAYNLNFLSAPNLLLTRPFKAGGLASKRVAALQSCITSHLDELQEGRHHRAWSEVKNPADTLGVTRFNGRAGK